MGKLEAYLFDGFLPDRESGSALCVSPLLQVDWFEDGGVAGNGHVLEYVLLHEYVRLQTTDVHIRADYLEEIFERKILGEFFQLSISFLLQQFRFRTG